MNSFLIFASLVFGQKTFAEPLNIEDCKLSLKKYHDTGKYYKEISQITYQIEQYINEKTAVKSNKKYALVLDIDETSLSNYQNIVKREFSNDKDRIHNDILKADATAITPIKKLFDYAKEHNVNVFFITGRYLSEKEATIKNLHSQGYSGWKAIFFRTDNAGLGSKFLKKDKASIRKHIMQQGYEILATVGDQESDLIGGYAQKTFKLPNPFYKAI